VQPPWRPAYVAIGSNLNSPQDRVREAFDRLQALPQLRSAVISRCYLSQPMGPKEQPDYVNAAMGCMTQLRARELLELLLGIEKAMGRDRRERWGARIIDLDLIWMVDGAVEEPGLSVPHPGVSSRNFVLYPLADIAPTLKIPALGVVRTLKNQVDAAGIAVLDQFKGFA
jgi:2-amino-4-hydroxy-6-hydroxymethyldihydropteridine diphosphokinase